MQTWAYLNKQEGTDYKKKAEELGLTEGELTQHLIRIFLNIEQNNYSPNCVNCLYYQIVNTKAIQSLMKVNEFLSLIPPEYKKLISKR